MSEEKKQSYLSRFKGEPIVTTIRLDRDFQADLRLWCIRHHISMAAFLEEAAREKLAKVLEEESKSKDIMGRH